MRLKDHHSFQPHRPFRIRILVFQNMLKNMFIKLYWICTVSVCYLAIYLSQLTTARFFILNFWRVWLSVFIHKWGPSSPMTMTISRSSFLVFDSHLYLLIFSSPFYLLINYEDFVLLCKHHTLMSPWWILGIWLVKIEQNASFLY